MGISSSAFAQAAYTGMFGPGPLANLAATGDTRDFSVTPLVGLQETVTDNVLLTAANKKFDFITRPMIGADVNVQGGPATATLSAHAYYDAYASQSQLSGFSGDAQGVGSYVFVPDFLTVDGALLLTNTSASSFGTPAIDRVGSANRVMVATYDVGPHLTTTVGDDFADLDVVGRFAQIFFGHPNNSTVGLPTDSSLMEGNAVLDTATRFLGYQATTNAQVERDDHGFLAYNAQQSLFVGIFPQIRVIARGGYDNVYQAGVVNISAPMWSGGLEYTLNELSKVSVEMGERYNHSAFAGDLRLQISDALSATGRYFEAIQPAQLQINSSFVSFALPSTPNAQVPAQLHSNFTINGNLDNQTTLNKEGDFRLIYSWETQSIGLGAIYDDRQYLTFSGHDRTLTSEVDYDRSIAPDLSFNASVNYLRTFANPFFGQNELYGGKVTLQYDLNSTMRAMGGYAYQRQAQILTSGQGVSENVLYALVVKRF